MTAINWSNAEKFLILLTESINELGKTPKNLSIFTTARFDYESHKVLWVRGLKAAEKGFTLEEARKEGGNALGIKCGVEVAEGLFLVGIDADEPSPEVFNALLALGEPYAATYQQQGSRRGHFILLTDEAAQTSSDSKNNKEAVRIQGAGAHLFAFCSHRNGKDQYTPLLEAPPQFITAEKLQVDRRLICEQLGAKTPSMDYAALVRKLRRDKKAALLMGGGSLHSREDGEQDRSADDAALAAKALYYSNGNIALAAQVLVDFGTTKCKERGLNYALKTAQNIAHFCDWQKVGATDVFSPEWAMPSQNALSEASSPTSTSSAHSVVDGSNNDDGAHSTSSAHNARVSGSLGKSTSDHLLYRGYVRGAGGGSYLHKLADFKPPEKKFLVDGLLTCGSVNLLASESGAGKSSLAAELAACVAAGRPFLGKQTTPGEVVLFDEDNEGYLISERFERIAAANPETRENVLEKIRIANFAGRDAFFDWLSTETAPPSLLILDVLRAFFEGNENDSENVGDFLRAIREYAERTQACVLLLHHFSKPPQVKKGAPMPEGKHRIRGSTALLGAVSVALTLERWRNEGKVELVMDKCRWAPPMAPCLLAMRYDENSLRIVVEKTDIDAGSSQMQVHAERFLEAASRARWEEFTRADVERALGLKKTHALNLIEWGKHSRMWCNVRGTSNKYRIFGNQSSLGDSK